MELNIIGTLKQFSTDKDFAISWNEESGEIHISENDLIWNEMLFTVPIKEDVLKVVIMFLNGRK